MVGMTKAKKYKVLCIFLLPNLLGMIVFLLVPMVSSLFLSFTDWDMLSDIKFVGLSNYISILQDKVFYEALQHTLTFIALYLPSVIFFALFIAMVLNTSIKGVKFFLEHYISYQ